MAPITPSPCAIVHYHEISLKRGNRPLFLRHLQQNIRRAVGDLGPARLVQLSGRIMLDLTGHPDPAAVRDRLGRVAGIANIALAERTGSQMDALKAAVERAIAGRAFRSFRITARRAFKTFPLTSVEINRALGAHVLALRPDVRVDLYHAELDVRVEVLPGEAFVYSERRAGPGGLPIGSGGTVAALLSGGIDSPVAAWRIMKRGCRVVFVHFHSVPYLPDTSQRKARQLVGRLTQWQYASRLFLVPFGEIQREVVLSVPPPARITIYRRLMVRIAERLARRCGALALVTGDSLGQVASQTLHNLACIDAAAELPILRPLIGMDKLEITAQAEAIDTFEISIEPDADCCTLFVPRHPGTRMSLEEAAAVERRLDVPALVAMGVDGAVEEDVRLPGGGRGVSPARAAIAVQGEAGAGVSATLTFLAVLGVEGRGRRRRRVRGALSVPARSPSREPVGPRFIRALARGLLALFYRRVDVIGAERVPPRGPVIVAANHQNALVDPMLLLASIPRTLVPLAKAPLFRHPVIGPVHQAGRGDSRDAPPGRRGRARRATRACSRRRRPPSAGARRS